MITDVFVITVWLSAYALLCFFVLTDRRLGRTEKALVLSICGVWMIAFIAFVLAS